MQGTVACAATVEIEVPLLDTVVFGPFAFDVPIPAIETAIDLGTRSLATGEMAGAMGICDDVVPMTSDDTGATMGDTAGDDVADTGDDANTSGTDDAATFNPSDEGDSTGSLPGDPDYPPFDGTCPPGYLGIGIGDVPPNAVCLPPCGGDQSCPSGASGNAFGECGYNPDSTYIACASDIDCSGDEFCLGEVCSLQPSHCLLFCSESEICPDAMICVGGVCTYEQG
jgi:hypothetical protein